jgi:hypothetical protein
MGVSLNDSKCAQFAGPQAGIQQNQHQREVAQRRVAPLRGVHERLCLFLWTGRKQILGEAGGGSSGAGTHPTALVDGEDAEGPPSPVVGIDGRGAHRAGGIRSIAAPPAGARLTAAVGEEEADRFGGDRLEPIGEPFLREPSAKLAQQVSPGINCAETPASGLAVGDPEIDAARQSASLRRG